MDRDTNALRIQTADLPGQATPIRKTNPASAHSSPILTPSGSTLHLPSTSLTPLPSPLVSAGTASTGSLDRFLATSPRRKGYGGLGVGISLGDRRNTTEFVPANGPSEAERSVSIGRMTTDDGLRREQVLRATKPRQSSVDDEIYEFEYVRTDEDEWIASKRRYTKTELLGRGAFSKVVLANPLDHLDSSEPLAIKVVNLDATEDAPASRITSSAKRELDILKKISYPSISRLVAYKKLPNETLLGLKYSRGGDLFNFASHHRQLLTPSLVKKIFHELVLAVDYLHSTMHVVHRDLKLENILLNYPASDLTHPTKYPPPLIALTDLGLSRPFDPESPLLTTRCGSTDYAAPEIMLGQPYDGRKTDAWALGVILYCLLESRLPFDPPPEARRAGKVAHRIAMGQWKWYRLARVRRAQSITDTDVSRDITVQPGGMVGRIEGEGAFMRGGGVWEGGMEIVEGLLRRRVEGRWGVSDILKASWLVG